MKISFSHFFSRLWIEFKSRINRNKKHKILILFTFVLEEINIIIYLVEWDSLFWSILAVWTRLTVYIYVFFFKIFGLFAVCSDFWSLISVLCFFVFSFLFVIFSGLNSNSMQKSNKNARLLYRFYFSFEYGILNRIGMGLHLAGQCARSTTEAGIVLVQAVLALNDQFAVGEVRIIDALGWDGYDRWKG